MSGPESRTSIAAATSQLNPAHCGETIENLARLIEEVRLPTHRFDSDPARPHHQMIARSVWSAPGLPALSNQRDHSKSIAPASRAHSIRFAVTLARRESENAQRCRGSCSRPTASLFLSKPVK